MKNYKFDNLYKKIYFSSIIKEEWEPSYILSKEKIRKYFSLLSKSFRQNFFSFLKKADLGIRRRREKFL